MKKTLLAMAAIPAATVAVEASAQTYVNNNAGATVQNQIVQLRAQLSTGIQGRTIDANEARMLRQQIQQLNQMRRQYSTNGLTSAEWNALQQRVGNINQQMQMASGYGYNQPYGNAYGYNNQQNGYSQPYGNAYGYTNNNGYASGNTGVAYDQYGRPVANGYSGQGGPYVPVPQYNRGVGNVLGGVLGSAVGGGALSSILGGGGLNVGTVITSVLGNALGGVPSNYANRYQSNGNTYFRSDGQRVYEIDARTNTVVRVEPLR